MHDQSNNADYESSVLELRTRLRSLRRQLEQRELTISQLNRRLMLLERGDETSVDPAVAAANARIAALEATIAEMDAARLSLAAERSSLADEVGRLYNTRLFRYASPARRLYSRLRRIL